MRNIIPLFILSFVLCFSCEKSEESQAKDPIVEEPNAEDITDPELTVTGFTEIIETYTDITIAIVDDSAVETKVMHNGEEIATSTEKQFDVSINPYGIPVGSTDFVVVSTDAKGNSISETFTSEIKHLLMTYNYEAQEDKKNETIFLFLNDLEGNPLANFKEEVGVKKIYSNELIADDKVYYSRARYAFDEGGGGSIINEGLSVTTYKIKMGETRLPFLSANRDQPSDYANNIELRINLSEENNRPAKYRSIGSNYRNGFVHDDDNSTIMFDIRHDATTPIYIRALTEDSNRYFDGKKENYRYMMLPPEDGNVYVEVDEDQFKPAEANFRLDLPSHDIGSAGLQRTGYSDIEAVGKKEYHRIYTTVEAENSAPDYYDLPILPDLKFYLNIFWYKKNGIRYYTQNVDSELDVHMPNWAVTHDISNISLNISAENPNVDLYAIKLGMSDFSDFDFPKRMSWTYMVFGEELQKKEAPRLKVPSAILDDIDVDYYRNSSELLFYGVDAFDYDNYDNYEELIDSFVLNKTRPVDGYSTYRKVSF